ncbi:MAG: hypothetical protein NVS9B14_20460 [Candidatus Acidiferrum sp.]
MNLLAAILLAVISLAGPHYSFAPRSAGSSQDHSDREPAKKRFRQALGLDPNNKEALFGLARIMIEEGDFASAQSLFRKYVAISPAEPGAWAYLLRCAVALKDPTGAGEAQLQIEHLAPANLALHTQAACWLAPSNFLAATNREFDLVISLLPAQTSKAASWYSRLGDCYERAHDPNRATIALQAALDLDPETEGIYFPLAQLLAREGKAGPASEVMNNAIARFPRSVGIRSAAGNIELESGNPERALESQRQAAALDPQSPGSWSLLGRIQIAQGRHSEATSNLEQAAKLAPADAAIHFYAGQAWMKTQDGTDRAFEHFKRSLELDPSRATTYYWLGSLYFHRNRDFRLAAQYLEQATDRDPQLEAAHQMLIQSYKRLGDDAKAAERLRRYEHLFQQRPKPEVQK